MKLIDKDAVVAEINRVLNSYDPNEITSGRYALVSLRNFLDTIEVKEVDLKKEIEEHAIHMPMSEFTHDSEAEDFYEWAKEEFRHFFELGMQQSKNYNNNEE